MRLPRISPLLSPSLLLAAGVLAGGCRADPFRPGPFTDDSVVLEMPVVQQKELYECGLASLSALCRYYGRDLASAEQDRLSVVAREHEGLSGAELRDALRSSGLDAWLFHGELGYGPIGAYEHLDAGRPLLVMISQDGESNHYGLLAGYDPVIGCIYLFDPRRGLVTLPAGVFQRFWANAGHFTLLALPRASESVAGALSNPELGNEQEDRP